MNLAKSNGKVRILLGRFNPSLALWLSACGGVVAEKGTPLARKKFMESSLICLWGHRALYKTLTGSHMAGPKRTGLWHRGSLYQEVWLKAATEDFPRLKTNWQYKQVILICMRRKIAKPCGLFRVTHSEVGWRGYLAGVESDVTGRSFTYQFLILHISWSVMTNHPACIYMPLKPLTWRASCYCQ
jgi:hypothetical protein